MNIGLGAIGGWFLVYFGSHSVGAALIAGIPCGMGGVALALFALRRLCPDLYFVSLSDRKRVMLLIPAAVVIMVGIDFVFFHSYRDPVSRGGFIFLEIGVVANLVYELVAHR